MNIWVDGDACPKAIKQILFRTAIKRNVKVFIVANHLVTTPASPLIKKILVEQGFDQADHYITSQVQPGDLVITADIILADHVITQQAYALNPRGTLYSADNIKPILTMRHMNESLREAGLIKSTMAPLSPKEIQNFANHLDRMLAKR